MPQPHVVVVNHLEHKEMTEWQKPTLEIINLACEISAYAPDEDYENGDYF